MEIPDVVFQRIKSALTGVHEPRNGTVELKMELRFKDGGFAGITTSAGTHEWLNAKEVAT